jgi:hypothetical protein
MISYLRKAFFHKTNKSGFNTDYRNGYRAGWVHNIRDYSP